MIYLDDQFPEHPKVVAAGGDAAWLYICILAWCRRHKTGGRVPKSLVCRLSDRRNPEHLARRLADVGLLDDHGADWAVHDYVEWNSGEDQQRANREERARRAATARWSPSNAQASARASARAPAQASARASARAPARAPARAEPKQCHSTTTTTTSRPATDPTRRKRQAADETKPEAGNPERPELRKLSEVMLGAIRACGGRTSESACAEVSRWALASCDYRALDEWIGAGLERNGRPRSARYFVTLITDAAAQHGVEMPAFRGAA